jgi:hypothetical protein
VGDAELERLRKLEDRGLDSGADVECFRRGGSRGGHERSDDVADEDVVARLLPIAEDGRRAAFELRRAEQGHDPRLSARVLARPVHIGETKRRGREAVEAGVQRAVRLGGGLPRSVGRHGCDPCRFGGRDRLRVAVQRTACRGEHDALRAMKAGGLEQDRRARDVDGGVEARRRDGSAHVDLRGKVKDDVRWLLGKDPIDRVRLTDVDLVQARIGVDVGAAAGCQVVEDRDGVILRDERIDEVRADEARSAGYQGVHAPDAIDDVRTASRARTRRPGRATSR